MGRPSGHFKDRVIYEVYTDQNSTQVLSHYIFDFHVFYCHLQDCSMDLEIVITHIIPSLPCRDRFPSLSGEIPASGDITKLWEIGP